MIDIFEPIYPVAEAARYLQLPTATLRSWVFGRPYPRRTDTAYFTPIIELAEGAKYLSFANLVEAYVLRALRAEHAVRLREVRAALDYAQKKLHIDRLLLSPELMTASGELFLERYGQLIQLSRSGQLAMKLMFEGYLKRIDWENSELPKRFYPLIPGIDGKRSIVIDPRIAFGRPVTVTNSISTFAIVERIDAGESEQDVAEDYALSIEDIQAAIIYESRAA